MALKWVFDVDIFDGFTVSADCVSSSK